MMYAATSATKGSEYMTVNVEAEKRAYLKFVAAGMTPEGACALIGHLEAESAGFYANRVEYLCIRRLKENGKTYTDETYTAAVDSGKISCEEFLHPLPGKQYGYGLAQWTSPGRKAGLWSLAKQKGVSIANEDLQLEYLLFELSSSYSSVLKVLKSATSIREASDVVLKKFEVPADTSESVCAGRAARGQAFYDSYVKNTKKEDKKVGVRVSNCGHDENGRYTGGKPGDQTGTEWYLRPWYAYTKGGWNYVIRWLDEGLGNLFADLAIEAAQNDFVGYCQGHRYDFWTQLVSAKYRPANIKKACEADCSSGTIALIKAVGYLKGIKELQQCTATYTGDMMLYFNSANGKKYFEVLTGKHLTDSSLSKRGDINLNTAHHVNITVDNGANAGTGASGSTGSQSKGGTCEVTLKTFVKGAQDNQIKAIQRILNDLGYKGKDKKKLTVDGSLGDNTAYAIEQFQRAKGMKNINFGTVAAATWTLLLNAK